MKSSKYWQERFTQLEDATNKDAMMVYRDVDQAYQKAQAEIEAKINTWYQRFATNNQISMIEARKLLTSGELEEFKWTVEEYIKHGKENAISGQWVKELENASARFHISRLEALKIQTQQSIEALYGNQLDTVDKAIKDMYSSRYYRTAFELQKGFGVGTVMDRLDNATLSNIVNKPWAVDGANFSSRIWSNKQKLVNELHSSLTRNIITGADPAKAIKEIKSKMGTSSYAAGRLIMTESAYFSSVAQKNVFGDLGVEKYEIIATLDSKTSEICRRLDGEVFDMKDFQAGVTAPPFHPYCRTTTAPHFDDWEELGIDRERVARNDKGDKYFVDGNMTYKEWEKQYVNKDAADDGKALNIDMQNVKINDKVMTGLSNVSQIKTNNDIKQFAEKLIDNLGIDRSNIPVRVKAIQGNGYCKLGNKTTKSKVYFDEYVLNSNDARSMKYRIKTAFHESFHLSANGLEWDGLDSSGNVIEKWRNLEETFTESSAHYLINKYGISDKLSPSYAQELVENLPRLKRLTKYSSCNTFQDFGKIAFTDRQNGIGAKWLSLHSEMSNVVLPIDYYSQYNSYIIQNEDDLFDMLFENLVGYSQYRPQMKAELKSAMGKDIWSLSGNERSIYTNILACAMQKMGVL